MTLKNIINKVNALKPNALTEQQLTEFLNTLEGRIQKEVWMRQQGEMIDAYVWETDQAAVLLMPDEYAEGYFWYLCAMVDQANGETNKYQNTMQIANDLIAAYQSWFIETYEPAQASRNPEFMGTIDYTAESGEAVELCTLPAGDLLLLVICNVEMAFDSGTSDVLILGTAADDDALMADGEIVETSAGLYAKAVNLTGGVAGTKIYAKLTKTGDAATQGSASFYGRVLEARTGWEVPG